MGFLSQKVQQKKSINRTRPGVRKHYEKLSDVSWTDFCREVGFKIKASKLRELLEDKLGIEFPRQMSGMWISLLYYFLRKKYDEHEQIDTNELLDELTKLLREDALILVEVEQLKAPCKLQDEGEKLF